MLSDETALAIESIQQNALSWLGRDPFDVQKVLRAEVEQKRKHRGSPRIEKNNDLIGAEESFEYLQTLIPEKLYGESQEEILDRFNGVSGTKYDRIQFLQRFTNTEALCHKYFTELLAVEKLEIQISSLPLTQINGVAFFTANEDRVVLLNEGLLYAVPSLLKNSIPSACLLNHHTRIQSDDEIGRQAANHVTELVKNNFGYFLADLVDVLSGEKLPFEMKFENGESFKPHADEKWAFMAKLRAEISKDHTEEPKLGGLDKAKKNRYLNARGFFILITAHEFSHFYRHHHEKRAEGQAIRTTEQCNEAYQFIAQYVRNPAFPSEMMRSEQFLTLQPTETEADADGLKCVVKYCLDNELGNDEITSTLKGALSSFIYMEISERIHLLTSLSPLEFENVRIMPEIMRNVLRPEEHPCATSRVPYALELDVWGDEYQPYKQLIGELWHDMHFTMDWIWCLLVDNLHGLLTEQNYKVRSQMNRSHLFQGLSAVGCFDGDKYDVVPNPQS